MVTETEFSAVQGRLGTAAHRTKQRDALHTYLLRGVIHCGICGRRMQGSARRSRLADRPVRVLYRCEFGSRRSIPSDLDHPSTVYVREDAVVLHLDAWLAEIVTPEALAASQEVPADIAARDAAIAAALADCDVRIERLLESIESGVEPGLIGPRVQKLQRERERLQVRLGTQAGWRRLSAREVSAWAEDLGGLVRVLERAVPEQRARVYTELGLKLVYHPGGLDRSTPPRVTATADLARVGRRVGGGT